MRSIIPATSSHLGVGITPTLFDDAFSASKYRVIDDAKLDAKDPFIYYQHPQGDIWVGDAIEWLRTLHSGSVDLIFADPPYNSKKS